MAHTYLAYVDKSDLVKKSRSIITGRSSAAVFIVPTPQNKREFQSLQRLKRLSKRKFGDNHLILTINPNENIDQTAQLKKIQQILNTTHDCLIVGPNPLEAYQDTINSLFKITDGKRGNENLRTFVKPILELIQEINQKKQTASANMARGTPIGGENAFQRKYLNTIYQIAQDLNGKAVTPKEINPNQFEVKVKKPKNSAGVPQTYSLIINPKEIMLNAQQPSDDAYEGFAKALKAFSPNTDPTKPFVVALYHPDRKELAKMVKACTDHGMHVLQGGFTDLTTYERYRKGFDLNETKPVIEEEVTTHHHTRRTRKRSNSLP